MSMLAYRRDIDGLRAIAVTSVVAYHAFPGYVPGGFVGVDIFFVISGFLISSIILKGAAQGNFSLLDFYARRIRRIFPALMVVLMFCLLAGWLLMFPDELVQLGKHVLGASFFVTNFVFLSEAGYFDIASELKPLLHLWSLSIEEQFYVLWPLMLLFFARKGWALLSATVLLLLSLLFCVSGLAGKTATFYFPLTRVWELLCGSVLASLLLQNTWPLSLQSKNVQEVLALVGGALLMVAVFVLDNAITFPGFATLLPVMGAVLLIASGPMTFVNRHVLGSKPFVFVGLISYSLYLWHWPLLSFPKITDGLVLPLATKAIAVIAATVLATLTYFWIEKPLRHRGLRTVAGLLVVALLIAGAGALFYIGKLQPWQSGELFQKVADAKNDFPRSHPLSKSYNVSADQHDYIGSGDGPQTTLYIGDSNMDQYWPAVEATLVPLSGTRKAWLAGCHLPIPHVILPGEEIDCSEINRHAYEIATKRPEIDTVVLAAFWAGVGSFQYVEGKQQYFLSTPEGIQKAMKQLELNIQQLKRHGKTVYLVLNIPYGPEFEPHELMHRSLRGFHLEPRLEGGISLAEHRNRTETSSQLLREVAQRSGAIVLDPADFLCAGDWCNAVTAEGDPVYRDMNHMRGTFLYNHPQFIAQTLLPQPPDTKNDERKLHE